MAYSTTGKDPEGRYWFKSDLFLTDITDAVDFKVVTVGAWRWKRYELVAKFVLRPGYYRDAENKRGYVPPITETKVIGRYEKISSASYALDAVMRLREIREISSDLDGSI